jgi:hypothetical protein
VNELNGTDKGEAPSYWANHIGDKNIEKYDLPKTSTQYEIETSQLESLFIELNKW